MLLHIGSEIDLLVIEFPLKWIKEWVVRCESEVLHIQPWRDEMLILLAERLWHLATVGVPRIKAESLGRATLSMLVRGRTKTDQNCFRGGLAGWRLRRVQEYMAAHLAEDLGLDDLAQIAGVSTAHFRERFKQSTGLSPHRYVLDARIKRAQYLLRETPSELNRITGLTPRQWREACRG